VSSELVNIDSERTLTLEQYKALADVPPEVEWLANITNSKTRRFYKQDVAEFVSFTGLVDSAALRTVARSHVIAWRKDMESRSLEAATIRRKLSALSSLFDYLCERNAVLGNPVDGSSARLPITTKAAPLPLVMRRRGGFWRPLPSTRSKACATGQSWPYCFITVSVVRSCVCSV
jgi:hypothetical protein